MYNLKLYRLDASLPYASVLLHWRYCDFCDTLIEACSWVQSSGAVDPSNFDTRSYKASANSIYYTFLIGSHVKLSFSTSQAAAFSVCILILNHNVFIDVGRQGRDTRHSTISCTFAAPGNQLTAYLRPCHCVRHKKWSIKHG